MTVPAEAGRERVGKGTELGELELREMRRLLEVMPADYLKTAPAEQGQWAAFCNFATAAKLLNETSIQFHPGVLRAIEGSLASHRTDFGYEERLPDMALALHFFKPGQSRVTEEDVIRMKSMLVSGTQQSFASAFDHVARALEFITPAQPMNLDKSQCGAIRERLEFNRSWDPPHPFPSNFLLGFARLAATLRLAYPDLLPEITGEDWRHMYDVLEDMRRKLLDPGYKFWMPEFFEYVLDLRILEAKEAYVTEQGLHLVMPRQAEEERIPPLPASSHLTP